LLAIVSVFAFSAVLS
jgi:RNA polymerase sigma factor (sigma-70 family)